MAKSKDNIELQYSLVPNTLPETDGYHRSLSHIGSKDGDAIFEGVTSKLHGQTAAGVKLVWEAMIDEVAENLAKYQYKSSVNGVTFGLGIPGSTDSINGTPEDGAYVTITLPYSMRNVAAKVTPVYSASSDDEPTVKSVEDVATRAANMVVGSNPFRVIGNNITAAGDDESVKVIAADGTEAVAEVDEMDGLGMFITAHLPAALQPGKGKVVLKTHGERTPEGELQQCVKSVTIVAGETPTEAPDITDAHSAGEGIDPTDIDGNSDFIIEGDHLQGVSVTMQYNNDGPWSDPATVPEASLSRAEGKVTVAAAWIGNQFGENNWDLGEGDNVKITVTNSAGSDSVERTVVYGA